MADHGDNYFRQLGPEGEEIGVLGKDCGHHCGAITVGNAQSHVGHCNCPECHNGKAPDADPPKFG